HNLECGADLVLVQGDSGCDFVNQPLKFVGRHSSTVDWLQPDLGRLGFTSVTPTRVEPGKFQKIGKKIVPVFGSNAFRMKLDAMDGQRRVLHAHDDAVRRLGRDLK